MPLSIGSIIWYRRKLGEKNGTPRIAGPAGSYSWNQRSAPYRLRQSTASVYFFGLERVTLLHVIVKSILKLTLKTISEYSGVCFNTGLLCPRPLGGGINRYFCLTSVCLSVAYIGNNSRTERLRKTKIGIHVTHVTHDSDTTFKVKRSKVNLQGRGNIVADLRTSLIFINSLIFMAPTAIGSKARWAPQA